MGAEADVGIRVEGLGKRFRLGEVQAYKTLRDSLAHALASRAGALRTLWSGRGAGHSDRHNELWALRDISFEIHRGESVGIIGGNGAGKSTLLKILSRITEPTEGEGLVRGRVGSLLEVGTGFHPELTGRENIYLNGAILGMPWAEIRDRFDEIVAFAEVERFIDTPVKHYSSGMYMRLAFSVAAHLQPDILMVDEVLAVGDLAFQKKCLGRMNHEAQEGRTVLFVSHNLSQIQLLCQRVLWLSQGRLLEDGPAASVIEHYMAQSGAGLSCERLFTEEASPRDANMGLMRVAVVDEEGYSRAIFHSEEAVRVECDCQLFSEQPSAQVIFEVNTQEGIVAFCTASYDCYDPESAMRFLSGRYRYRCTIPPHFLNRGQFTVSVWATTRLGHYPIVAERVVVFEISEVVQGHPASHRRRGIFRPHLTWTIEPDPRSPDAGPLETC